MADIEGLVPALNQLAEQFKVKNALAYLRQLEEGPTQARTQDDPGMQALHQLIREGLGLEEKAPEPAPVVDHYRIGPGQCHCGFNAYHLDGIMLDYGEILQQHLRKNRF